MSDFLEAAFTMPTTIFSVLMILIVVYWLTVILGVMDLGILDGLFDAADGLAEGAMGSVEGAAEGLAEAAAEGAAESAGEHSGCLGLAGVPFTIIGSVLAFFAWGFSYGGMKLLSGVVEGTMLLAGVGVAAVVLSAATTAAALRPVRKLFRFAPVTGRRDLVGRICQVRTLRVDERFGQAEVQDNGATILIQARCSEANDLTRGSKALIFQYDDTTEVFYISPLDEGLAALTEESDSSTG